MCRRNFMMDWIQEQPALWDETKQNILGANKGAFDIEHTQVGGELDGVWFKLIDNNEIIGYGWIDLAYGNPEISIAVDSHKRFSGYGNTILRNLEEKALALGFSEVECIVRRKNADAINAIKWFHRNGFVPDWPGQEISIQTACSLVSKTDIMMRKKL
jgi:ribosomal protein S18 acetylase RimI-like enzyme